jgi:hypothetical protein
MVAIPTTVDQAEPSRPTLRCQGRSGRALHLVAAGQVRTPVYGSTADGMAESQGRRYMRRRYWKAAIIQRVSFPYGGDHVVDLADPRAKV